MGVAVGSGGSLVEPAQGGDHGIAKESGGIGQLEKGRPVGGVPKIAKGCDGPQAKVGG